MRLTIALLLATSAFAGREVAITIDDLPRGGDGEPNLEAMKLMTTKLLQPFAAGKIPLIGFANECHFSDGVKEILAMWKAAGAELGNHTCSHPDLNTTPVEKYKADIEKGEKLMAELLGHRPRYFRHPFLHAGKDAETKRAINDFLKRRGYSVAPVTLDNSDYLFAKAYMSALQGSDGETATKIREAYLSYMESIFEFFEKRSIEVTGHEIRQTLLIHANQLNADTIPQLIEMMKRRGYRIVTLGRALAGC
ncbi:MAG TPA: polysaccharide deacetylase family protein [Bryobacteraceae bacterium]|nr:polysaccharide deacetylase family protein [Bryobacteraceae bacterium]